MQREHIYWNNGARLHFAEFAREPGVSQGRLSRHEQGRCEIGAAVLLPSARIGENNRVVVDGKRQALTKLQAACWKLCALRTSAPNRLLRATPLTLGASS